MADKNVRKSSGKTEATRNLKEKRADKKAKSARTSASEANSDAVSRVKKR